MGREFAPHQRTEFCPPDGESCVCGRNERVVGMIRSEATCAERGAESRHPRAACYLLVRVLSGLLLQRARRVVSFCLVYFIMQKLLQWLILPPSG